MRIGTDQIVCSYKNQDDDDYDDDYYYRVYYHIFLANGRNIYDVVSFKYRFL